MQPIQTLYAYQNDTSPDIIFNMSRRGESIVDLTGASVAFTIERYKTTEATNEGTSACVVTDAAAGVCQYRWINTDLPSAGLYNGWLVITFQDGQTETTLLRIQVSPKD